MTMNKEPKQTILYGGAFNPPTKAHAAIVKDLAEMARQDDADLWLMPSGERHDKSILADLAIRTAYVQALLDCGDTHDVDMRIEDYELLKPDTTETFTTNSYLEQQYPDRRFTWVFGSDSVNTMRRWRRGAWLLEHLDMIIIERPGYELTETPRQYRSVRLGEMAMSSSEVRRRIIEGSEIDSLVPARVIDVLRQTGVLSVS